MLHSPSRYSSHNPFYSSHFGATELETPRDLVVPIEERFPLDELLVMVSYAVRLSYTSESQYSVTGFDLVRERRDAFGKLVYSKTPLEHLTHTEVRIGLDAMFREDILAHEVMEQIAEAIIADARVHDQIAREEAADLRRSEPIENDDLIDF